MNKTVAIFNGYYLPHLGGVERYTYNISKKLRERGYNVIIVTTQHSDDLLNEEVQEGIKIYRLPVKNIWKNRYPFLKKNALYHSLIKKISAEPIDYYVANTRFHLPALLGTEMAKKNGKEAIVIEHGSSYLTLNQPALDFFLQKIEHWLIKKVKKNTSLFYGVSNEASEWLKTFNIHAKGTLPNAVSIEEYNNQKIEKVQDRIIISYAGRLIPQMKGVEILLSAFEKLAKEREDLELIIAGDGPLLKDVQTQYQQKNITFLGRLPYEKVLELDAKSDIFVLMSRSEGFATAMLEAAMLENVVIATPTVGGARDIMPDQSYGFIIENNENALLQTLKNVIADKEEMRRIQKKVSKNVVENFTWEQSTDAFVKVFKELDEKKMKEITQEELREIQLDQLAYIDDICRANGIEYTLAGGSLIGAMRHGGYIPWDDDIDIELTRSNYERLIKILMEKLPDEKYALLHYKVREAYLPFAKIYDTRTTFESKIDNLNRGTGVFLDIFPMDILPNNEEERKRFKKEFLKKAVQLTASNPHGVDFASASRKLYFWGS